MILIWAQGTIGAPLAVHAHPIAVPQPGKTLRNALRFAVR